jgi:hypothetical protein
VLTYFTCLDCDFSHFIVEAFGLIVHAREKGTAMNTFQSPCQFHTLFGTGYVPEQHSDEVHPSLLLREPSKLDFASILEKLRSALGIRRA